MLTNINKNRGLEIDIDEVKNDENEEYYVILKVSPDGQHISATGEVTQKLAVLDGSVKLLPKELIDLVLQMRSEFYQKTR